MGVPDAQIVFLKAPFIQYEQILLTKNFRQYLETMMLSSKVSRMGIQKTLFQKIYKLQMGLEGFTVGFKGCKRQFDWLEISLVYNKSDKHLRIYNSYNAECAAKIINVSSSQIFPMPTTQQTQNNLIHQAIIKNTCCGNNMLHGIAMDIALLQFPITSITLSFKSFCWNPTILAINPMKKYILTCETASHIQTKLKKPSRND